MHKKINKIKNNYIVYIWSMYLYKYYNINIIIV